MEIYRKLLSAARILISLFPDIFIDIEHSKGTIGNVAGYSLLSN
jgi:hypothetical protein